MSTMPRATLIVETCFPTVAISWKFYPKRGHIPLRCQILAPTA